MKNKGTQRRDFIKLSALGLGAVFSVGPFTKGYSYLLNDTKYELPPLPYATSALEPYIDEQTMQIHHDRHHAGYVKNLNSAVESDGLSAISLDELLRGVSKYSNAIRNNGGGHYNHSLFWKLMTPAGGGDPSGPIADAIDASFGSFEKFQELFNNAAKTRFGSGWAWLVSNNGKLEVGSTPNQDNPLMDVSDLKGFPLIGIDVWEHAYYLKYQNKRGDYIDSWWRVINWNEVNKRLALGK